MEIRIRRSLTGRQLRDQILSRYGSREAIEGKAKAGDVDAQDGLWNLQLIEEDASRLDEVMEVEDLIVLEHNDLSKLTKTRLALLSVLREMGETTLMELTEAVGRDQKNVSKDIAFLSAYGLVEAHRHGRHRHLSAAGNEIVVAV